MSISAQKLNLGLVLCTLLLCCPTLAANWLEKGNGYVIDWTNMRISFSGAAKNTESYEDAVQKAWADGLIRIRDEVKALYKERVKIGSQYKLEKPEMAGSNVARNTFELKTFFGGAGDVKVDMQSLLSNAFPLAKSTFSSSSIPHWDGKFTGVLFKVPGQQLKLPIPLMRLFDEKGNLIYGPETMTLASYNRRLMGRWLQKTTADELKRFLGSKILTLELKRMGSNSVDFKLPSKINANVLSSLKSSLAHKEVVFLVQ